MKPQKNQKAQAHIEIVIAFTLFIGIVLTFFILVKPFAYTQAKPQENIQSIILNSITERIGILSVTTKIDANCYSINDVLGDYGNNFVEIKENSRKYEIYFHSMFVQREISCAGNPEDFSLGIYTTQNLLTKPRIITLKDQYETNYPQLKQTLGIKRDFVFEFKDLDRNMISELTPLNQKIPPTGVNVIANEFPVQVIDSEGGVEEYILNLRIW